MDKKPQLEEVDDDDIDNMDLDIAQFDPSLKTPFAPVQKPVITRSQDAELQAAFSAPTPQQTPARAPQKDIVDPAKLSDEEKRELANLQIIYPCYFDLNRSHRQGRRVSEDLAVENPLAKTISDACRALDLPVLLELDKTHPQDFGNPGRVRVQMKENGEHTLRFTTKRALFVEVAKYLQAHPTTIKSVSKESGVPFPREFEDSFVPEELPKVKGFKMSTIAPAHSRLTMKHPMTKSIYDPEPEAAEAPKLPKAPKKKVMKIRG